MDYCELKDAIGVKQIISLDFETYYDKDYTLKKLSTTEYVRSKLFKAHCVAIQIDDGDAEGYTDAKKCLESLDWRNSALLCHHTHFDGLILSHHYGITPAFYLDTLSMARPLHGGAIRNDLDTLAQFYGVGNKLPNILEETKGIRNLSPELETELIEYNNMDVTVMWGIFNKMLDVGSFSVDELRLIHHTVRAYAEPILQVNKSLAKKVHKQEVEERNVLVESTGVDRKSLTSREKFAQLLRDQGVEPPMKINPKGNPTYAFAKNDLDYQALEVHDNETVRTLVKARKLCTSSIEETRALRLISHSTGGNLPIYLKYGGAHTLRWSGGDKMNPQNLKRRSSLREAIHAPPGHVLVIFDSGQIEARVNGWLAGEDWLIDSFRDKDNGGASDPYKIMAAALFHKDYDEVTRAERFVGKTCILGLGYQMGAQKLWWTLVSGSMGPPIKVTIEECEAWVHAYRRKNKKIKSQWRFFETDALPRMGKKTTAEVKRGPITFVDDGYISSNGMFMRYPNLRHGGTSKTSFSSSVVYKNWTYGNNISLYGGKMAENTTQNLARNLVAWQILQVAEQYRLTLQVHDEGVFCVPKKQADQAYEDIDAAFKAVPPAFEGLPVIGDGVISRVYEKPG